MSLFRLSSDKKRLILSGYNHSDFLINPDSLEVEDSLFGWLNLVDEFEGNRLFVDQSFDTSSEFQFNSTKKLDIKEAFE